MKQIEHLSPTSIALWGKSRDDFYLNYLSDLRPDRFPQTRPMSIGSAFDAYCKNYLHERLFGAGNDPAYALDAIFEAQVEEQNRDWARPNGKYCFAQYQQSGALADLMLELQNAQGPPRFEFTVKGTVSGFRESATRTIGEVVLLGKPDVAFINKAGASIILDWKVSGFLSKASPMPGYLRLRSAGNTSHGMHKACQPMMVSGVMVNIATNLESLNEDWARQLSIYGWLLGEPVGSGFIVAIDQVACDASKKLAFPTLRFAEHRLTTSRRFQEDTFQQACDIWEIVHSGHIFRDLSPEDSRAKCDLMDGVAGALVGEGSDADKWFSSVCRTSRAW